MFAPIVLVLEEYLVEAVLVDVGVVLAVGLRVRCFVSTARSIQDRIVVLQARLAEADVSEDVSFRRIALDFLVCDYWLGFGDFEAF